MLLASTRRMLVFAVAIASAQANDGSISDRWVLGSISFGCFLCSSHRFPPRRQRVMCSTFETMMAQTIQQQPDDRSGREVRKMPQTVFPTSTLEVAKPGVTCCASFWARKVSEPPVHFQLRACFKRFCSSSASLVVFALAFLCRDPH